MSDTHARATQINPLDPAFDKPGKTHRFYRMNKDCDYYRIPCGECKKGYKTVSVYRGMYYQADESSEESKRRNIAFALGLSFAFMMFLISSIIPYEYNALRYAGIMEGITLVSFSFVLVKYIISLFTDSRMTEYVYKTTALSLTRGCMFTLVMLVLCLVGVIIGIVSLPDELPYYILAFFLFTLSAGGMYFLWKLLKGVSYTSWKSRETLPQ